MNLLPKTHEEFSQKDYWDNFFKKRGQRAFEWYGEYPELSEHLHKYIKPKDDLLIVGCGNSTLGNDLYDVSYKNITSIDISQVVIKQMSNVNAKIRPEMKFLQMDALNMSFANESFTVVLDKGTLDALMPDETSDTIDNINKYFEEIQRVLKTGGRYLCISLLQEHILQKLLSDFPQHSCMFRVVRCHDAEKAALDAGENLMPVFLVICTKFQSLPFKVLEINLGIEEKMQRLQTSDEMIDIIASTQKAAFICSGLRRGSIGEDDEVMFDLYKQVDMKPRFTVFVLEQIPKSKQVPYAAFIVPQGRESEWLFSTPQGRKNLLKMTNHTRLAIVTLHRGQLYKGLQDVQDELNNTIKNLAPKNMSEKIAFLSIGSDVGSRTVMHEGNSEYSGNYVIEDVEVEGNQFRRLYFLSTQSVIQSDAKLKTGKSRKGKQHKLIVDHTHLTCKHHVYMSISSYVAVTRRADAKILVIGLGGGGLCMFLRKFLPKLHITAVDIDDEMLNVARDWFNLQEDEKMKTVICDGLHFLRDTAENSYDAILFDVDNKDTKIGMSCPPKEFLEVNVLSNVKMALKDDGLFVLNVVIRDTTLKPSVMVKLGDNFKTVATYKLEEDLNEIVLCSKLERQIKEDLVGGCEEINAFFKRNNGKEQVIDVKEFIDGVLVGNKS